MKGISYCQMPEVYEIYLLYKSGPTLTFNSLSLKQWLLLYLSQRPIVRTKSQFIWMYMFIRYQDCQIQLFVMIYRPKDISLIFVKT